MTELSRAVASAERSERAELHRHKAFLAAEQALSNGIDEIGKEVNIIVLHIEGQPPLWPRSVAFQTISLIFSSPIALSGLHQSLLLEAQA